MAGPKPEPGSPSAPTRRPDPRYVGKDLGTQGAHAGERWERPGFWPSSTPIHKATTFVDDRAEDLDDVVWRRKPGYSYSRAGSPTTSAPSSRRGVPRPVPDPAGQAPRMMMCPARRRASVS